MEIKLQVDELVHDGLDSALRRKGAKKNIYVVQEHDKPRYQYFTTLKEAEKCAGKCNVPYISHRVWDKVDQKYKLKDWV